MRVCLEAARAGGCGMTEEQMLAQERDAALFRELHRLGLLETYHKNTIFHTCVSVGRQNDLPLLDILAETVKNLAKLNDELIQREISRGPFAQFTLPQTRHSTKENNDYFESIMRHVRK